MRLDFFLFIFKKDLALSEKPVMMVGMNTDIFVHQNRKFCFRWRKSSATWVIYEGRKIYESGFGSSEECTIYLQERIFRNTLLEKRK